MNVGILQPKPGTGYDRLVADMIAPTPRPGHDPIWEAFPGIARNHLKATLHQLHAFGHLTRFA